MSALLVLSGLAVGETRVYVTGKANPGKPLIDGRLDDGVWNDVPWGDGFVQHEPHDGAAPTQQTSFKILYDDENLYVGFRCCDSECDKIVRRVTRRDTEDGDRVAIHLDTYFDHRTAFVFTISAAGVKIDEIASQDGDNQTGKAASHRTVGFKRNSSLLTSGGHALTRDSIGHNGFTGTSIWLEPGTRTVFILLSNRIHPVYKSLNFNRTRRKLHKIIRLELGV